ncbi:MAG: TrkH family potassium uptake protein [Candidatus Margulisbacteria bacterium]|jgi:trk system potassium uptake protein TrkH|nr:TrkH family potassium uptake protein [Candidatus Margulisiibacteriota bacterium]
MLRLRPHVIIAFSFFLIILIGGILLSLPAASAGERPTNFLDACFTANSATCVTGLVTLDTGTHWSLFGLIVIMGLMQIGGLGYMTFSTFMLLVFRHKLFISQKLIVKEALNIYSSTDVLAVMRRIFVIVFTIEGLGALILFTRWLPEFGWKKGLLYSVFHSISAFNNAGFALPANYANLMPYVTDPLINLTITTLVIIGGIGFIVIADLLQHKKFSLHSKVALSASLLLIVLGSVAIFALEHNNPRTLGPLSLSGKAMASYFQAVTPRTAGFNTIDIARVAPATALFMMLLMFIGASPGGTGGGIKTTTFALIIATIWATLKGFKNTVLFNRRVPAETIRRAIAVAFLALALVAVAVFALNNTERFGLMEEAFEVFSAFGTVGLSMGITPGLSSAGKLIIMLVMFIGRVGPLTLLLALAIGQKEPRIKLPKEGISIG